MVVIFIGNKMTTRVWLFLNIVVSNKIIMNQYKDIINFSIIKRLREKMSDACIIFNNLINPNNVKNRESNYYEVYTSQYHQDMNNICNLRDRCMKIADECNKIMLNMNVYHIKQYYLNPDELSEYEDFERYKVQLPQDEQVPEESNNENYNPEDW